MQLFTRLIRKSCAGLITEESSDFRLVRVSMTNVMRVEKMVIVNALPGFGIICAVFVNVETGVATDEIHIELNGGVGSHIVLEDGCSMLGGVDVGHLASGILTMTGLKASDALGTPRFEHNWRESSKAIGLLNTAFSYGVNRYAVEQSALMYAAATNGQNQLIVNQASIDTSAILGSNTRWFTDGEIISVW